MTLCIKISANPCASATDLALHHAVTQARLIRARHGAVEDHIEIEVPAWDDLGGAYVFAFRAGRDSPLELQLREYVPEEFSDEDDRQERGFRATLSAGASVTFTADPSQECPLAVALVGLATLGSWWAVDSSHIDLWVHDCEGGRWERVTGPLWAVGSPPAAQASRSAP